MNRFSKFRAACLTLLVSMIASLPLYAQEEGTEITGYQFPEWNECNNITLRALAGTWTVPSSEPTKITCDNTQPRKIQVDLEVTNEATLVYEFYRYSSTNAMSVIVNVDGVDCTNQYDVTDSEKYYFVELSAGKHTVILTHKGTNNNDGWYLTNLGVLSKTENLKKVNLLEPGSLGQEILSSGVNSLFDVRSLKVTGKMNDVDLNTITKMKDNLFYLDLSAAEFEDVPEKWLYQASMIHTVVLPENVKSIGDNAFYNSSLKKINFPNALESVGDYSFRKTNLEEAIINDNCTKLGQYSFCYCGSLRKVKFPINLTVIPYCSFDGCNNLYDITFPENLKVIESYAFSNINLLGLTESLKLPNGISSIGGKSFSESGYLKVVLPTSLFKFEIGNSYSAIFNSSKIREVRLESPTVVNCDADIFSGISHSNMKLVVPDFLVNSYKLADYWYDFGTIEGFSTSEISEWELNNDLTLDAHNRFENTPALKINKNGSFSVIGTDPLTIGDLSIASDLSTNTYGRVIGKIDDFTVNGNVKVSEYMLKNKWYFISLPFNVSVSDIVASEASAQRAIRYYDGANRAANGTTNNWVNYAADAVIPAGTGFIFLSSADAWWTFPAQSDASKQYITSNNVFVKELAANTSATASDKGWNLVGNPYQAWYNIHMINFSAPITVRNVSKNTYEAYSIIDDDYALAPNQAFFVQCPDGTTQISFPVNGRQLTSEVLEQNGAPAKNPQIDRVLVDIALNSGENSDRTRVVLNSNASLDYETTCDASKFLSEASVAQVYTLDAEGTQYAINERPVMNGEIQLGVTIPNDGVYSFSLLRNMADNVFIRDNESGETVELTASAYEFFAEAGTYNQRFTLILKSGAATGIEGVQSSESGAYRSAIYNLNGQKVNEGFNGIVIKNGKKVLR